MKNKIHLLKTNKVGFVLGAVLLAALTECVGNADGQNVVITVPPPVVMTPAVIQDNYTYYPSYGVYFNKHGHQYYWLKGDAWVTQPEPQGVKADVLLASPSVDMDFHDSPANHHKEMLQKYPKNWKPSAVHQDQNHDLKDTGPDHDKKQVGH